MTDDEKLEKVIEHLTTYHLDEQGGYPFAFGWIGDTLAIAAIDHDDASELQTYARDELIRWHDRAAQFATDEDMDFASAMFETAEGSGWRYLTEKETGVKID